MRPQRLRRVILDMISLVKQIYGVQQMPLGVLHVLSVQLEVSYRLSLVLCMRKFVNYIQIFSTIYYG